MLSCVYKVNRSTARFSLPRTCCPPLPHFKPAPVPKLILGQTIQFNLSNQNLGIDINSSVLKDPNWICGSQLTFSQNAPSKNQYGLYIYLAFDKEGQVNELGLNENGMWKKINPENVFTLLTRMDWNRLKIEKPYHTSHQFDLSQPALSDQQSHPINISGFEPIAEVRNIEAVPTHLLTADLVLDSSH